MQLFTLQNSMQNLISPFILLTSKTLLLEGDAEYRLNLIASISCICLSISNLAFWL